MDSGDVVRLVILLVAVLLSGFFSGSEAAFLSIQRGRLASMVKLKVRGADRVARLANQPEKLLPTVLTGNNLVNVAAAALATTVATSYLSSSWAVLVSTVGVTITLLVFAETIPKTISAKRAEKTAILAVRSLEIAQLLFFPVVWVLERLSRLVARWAGVEQLGVTEEEIRSLIDLAETEGALASSEAQMLEQVFYFGDRQIHEVMVPRTEIVWVEKGTTLEGFVSIYLGSSYTRFPVYQGDMENVVGILSTKDLLKQTASGAVGPRDSVTQVLQPALFVPEVKLVAEMLDELKAKNQSMAVLVDEYGGIAGLVTAQHLLEVIAGRVREEDDLTRESVIYVAEGLYDVDGGISIHEINQKLELDLPDDPGYETLAGFMLKQMGRIPQENEWVQWQGIRLVVKEMQRVKIERIEVSWPTGSFGASTRGEVLSSSAGEAPIQHQCDP